MRAWRWRFCVVAGVLAIVVLGWRSRSHGTQAPAGGAAASSGARSGTASAARGGPAGAVAQIHGTVLLDDSPASGVVVQAVHAGDIATAVSDEHGAFVIDVRRSDRYTVFAEKLGVTGASTDVDLRDRRDAPIVLVLHACAASVHGLVRDASGGPVAHARVSYSGDADSPGPGGEATNAGLYDVCVPRGDGFVTVTADGYADDAVPLAAYGRVRRDFVLVPEAPVVGRVVLAADQTAVLGAEVVLDPESPAIGAWHTLHATSDSDGKFRIAGASPGRYMLGASAERLTASQPVAVVAEVGVANEAVVELVPAVVVSGKVVAGARGLPAVNVWLDRPYGDSVLTHADGTFAFEHVLPGDYTPVVDRMTSAKKTIHVTSTDVTGLELEAEPGCSIAGIVTHDGKPVEGTDVSTDRAATVTDAHGRYELRGLPAGTHRVYAESKRLGVFTPGPDVTVAQGEQKTGVDIDMNLAGAVSGVVIDQDGAPVSGAIVQLSLLHGRDFGTGTTAEDGTFTAAGLSGGGSYVYQVRPAERQGWTYPPADGKHFTPIAVKDGTTRVTGVTIRVKRDRLAIAGHVLTATGDPVPDAVVRIAPRMTPMTSTDVAGAFTLTDLPPGSYTIVATTTHGEEWVENIAAGRRDVVIKLRPGATIEGTVEGFATPPMVYAFLRGKDTSLAGEIHGSHFAFRAIPPGTYALMASDGGGEASETVTVAPGATTTVVLRAQPFGVIVGHVRDARTHAPVPGLRCMADGPPAETSADGSFRIEGARVGATSVYCYGIMHASASVIVVSGQTVEVELEATPIESTRRSRAGLVLEQQFDDVLVQSIDPGGPAEHAGLAVNDAIRKLDGYRVKGEYATLSAIESLPPGTAVSVTIERDGTLQTVTLTVAPL